MALKIGQKGPNFSLLSTSGETFKLNETLKGKPCILYFYPKDFTPTCTKESCEFRDNFEGFKNAKVDVLGISFDSVKTHLDFKKAYNLPFELLADEDGKVADLYKATIPFLKISRRISYFLDENHIVRAVYENMFASSEHVEKMMENIKPR